MSSEGVNRFFPEERPGSPVPEEVSGHEFSLGTRRIEMEALAFAAQKAEEHVAKGAKLAHVAAMRICKEAYVEFERKMKETFATTVASDLMTLTLQSREKLFFFTLQNRLIEIIKAGKDTEGKTRS